MVAQFIESPSLPFMPKSETFAEFLRSRRGKMTQSELADKADVSQSYVSGLERGINKEPDPEIIYRLADALGVSRYEMMKAAYPEHQVAADLERLLDPDTIATAEMYENLSPNNRRVARSLIRELLELDRGGASGDDVEGTPSKARLN